jgi:hypothetical protein
MKRIPDRGRTSPVLGWLSIVVAVALAACGSSSTSPAGPAAASGSPTPAPTASAIPEAATGTFPPGTVTACGAVDVFTSGFMGAGSVSYWVTVKLGELNCPAAGDIGLQVAGADNSQGEDVGKLLLVGEGVGTAYLAPQGDVQATFTPPKLPGYRLVVAFTSQTIEKVTLEGNGATVDLHRQ